MGEQDNMWVCKSGVGEDVQGCVRQRGSESCSFCCLPGYTIILLATEHVASYMYVVG